MNIKNGWAQNGQSLALRIAGSLFVLVAAQGLVLMCAIMITGAIKNNYTVAYEALANQSNNRKNEMQEMFNAKRKNIVNTSLELSGSIDLSLRNQTSDNISGGLMDEVLDLSLDSLILFTKYNEVTGAFVVIDPSGNPADETAPYRASLYIRDSSPGITAANNSNLLLEYGPVEIARSKNIGVDYLWTRNMSFEDDYDRDFYFKPVRAASQSDSIHDRPQTYGYWSAPFTLRKHESRIVTYTVPLTLEDGTIFGVIGFELDLSYVSANMPAAEVPYGMGFYLLEADKGDGVSTDNVISSGAYAKQFLAGPSANLERTPLYESETAAVYNVFTSSAPDNKVIGAYSGIGLYETFSPFYGEKWSLYCLAPAADVMRGSNNVKNSIIASIIISTALALVASLFVFMYISVPIRRLFENVKSTDPERPVRLERTGIVELDRLSGAFEALSDGVSEAAARMFKIIELVDMPIGSFEIRHKGRRAHMSESLFRMLHIDMPADGSANIPIDEWDAFINQLKPQSATHKDDITETLYETKDNPQEKRWFRMRRLDGKTRDIGILIDVTDEITQKQRLEFERNYDPLTKLLNRQAFLNRSFEVMRAAADSVGIMMFADLDDLKFINDRHGHETGDAYIRAFAAFLERFIELNAVVARMSGDEFVMFMCGFRSKEEARKTFDIVFAGINDLCITARDGHEYKLRVSVGLAYYPSDSGDIKELIKNADYAMYESKHSAKGEIREFKLGFQQDIDFAESAQAKLELLINEQRIYFVFEPIADAKTGAVFGYDSVMRPADRSFASQDDILDAAQQHSMLTQAGRLMFGMLSGSVAESGRWLTNQRIFITAATCRAFSDDEAQGLAGGFGRLFGMAVFVVEEKEFANAGEAARMLGMFRWCGALSAIGGYGAGYGADPQKLLAAQPDFIKIDESLTQNIHNDADKQLMVGNALAFAAKNGMRTIAEGVNNREDMETLARLGADYLQGQFLARPSMEFNDINDEAKQALSGLYP